MDYYKILDVEKNASKKQIKEAYEKQVKRITSEITDEKRLKLFLKLFDEAYEALSRIKENENVIKNTEVNRNETVVGKPYEIEQEIEKQNRVNNKRRSSLAKNKSKSKTSKTRNSGSRGKFSIKNEDSKEQHKDKIRERSRKQNSSKKSKRRVAGNTYNLFMLPIKILAIPLIVILSLIILLCQIINIVSWLASKVMIVGGISIGAIHLYQINIGHTADYKILIFAIVVVIASFFLPYILKMVPRTLGRLNDKLKKFVF
ncbi:MAG: molecular chaperone DnaJ [Clostridium sp.]|uniref:molecular chaperone DnaJ n=1 Tax=Clostridium sp. TaxID=1506 RepID=UPI003046F7C1